MSHLDVRIAQYATTSPAWGERTGRCGVWDKWKAHNRTFWGIAEAMAEQWGNASPFVGLDSYPPILS